VEDDLEVHEIFAAAPFDVHAFGLVLLVEGLEVSADVGDCLLNLVVAVRLVQEGPH
jgi:hypothetical protein